MSQQPFLTVSAVGLRAAGVTLSTAEAVACVVLAGDALDWSADPPDASQIVLRSDGRVDVTPGRASRLTRVEAYARLLHRLLPESEATAPARVPGALRLAVARGLGVLDAPPFASPRDFRTAIVRFLTASPEELIVGIVVRWAEAMGARAEERPPERRAAGARVDVLRRMLRDADLERFALLNERTPAIVARPALPAPPALSALSAPIVPEPPMLPLTIEREQWPELPPHSMFGSASAPPPVRPGGRLRAVAGVAVLAGVLGWAATAALRNADLWSGTSVGWSPAPRAATSARDGLAPSGPAGARGQPPMPSADTSRSGQEASPGGEATQSRGGTRVSGTRVSGMRESDPRAKPAAGRIATGDTAKSGRASERAAHEYGPTQVSTMGEVAAQGSPASQTAFQLANVVDGSHRTENVSLSPDGSRVAFDSDRDGVRAVYVAARDGTDVRRVSGPGYAAGPAWSPDGQRLAMLRGEERMPEVHNLWVLDLQSGDERRLTQYRYGEMSPPSWFADGRRIAYAQEGRLFVMDTGSGATRNYESPIPGRSIPVLAPSPDHRHVVFAVLDNGVWLLDVHDGSVRRVLDDPTVERLVWSPEGRRVAYYSRRARHWGVWVTAGH